jgi:hypothetical protein
LHGGVIGTALLWPLRRLRLGEVLGANAQLAAVIAVTAAWDVVREDAGLSSRMWWSTSMCQWPRIHCARWAGVAWRASGLVIA